MSERGYAVFCGLDVGKIAHHAVARDPAGARLHDAALPQDEARLRQLFTDLLAALDEQTVAVSAYDLTCRSAYDLTCRSVFGESLSVSP